MIKLPRELLDRVIDHLHGDAASLRSACLVHTWWIPSCRRHIFASVTFRELFDIEVWVDSFPSALHSPARHVRKLSMSGLWASLGDEEFNPDEFDESILEHFHSFDQVRTLVFTRIKLHPHPSNREMHFSHLRSCLTSLEFYSPFPTSPTQLLHFICSFPHLNNLAISGPNRWAEEGKEGRMDLQTSPPLGGKLRLLDFSDPGGTFVDRLVDLPNGVRFKSIELDLVQLGDYRPTGRLVSACTATLEALQLSSSFAGCPNINPEVFNLKQNGVLREFNLIIAVEKPFSCTWIEVALSSVASPSTTFITVKLEFTLSFMTVNQFKLNDWDLLDAILTSSIERGVANKIVIHGIHGPDDLAFKGVVALIESVLPRLKARGLITIGVGRASEGRYYGSYVY